MKIRLTQWNIEQQWRWLTGALASTQMGLRNITVKEKEKQIGVLSINTAFHSVLPSTFYTPHWGHQEMLPTRKERNEFFWWLSWPHVLLCISFEKYHVSMIEKKKKIQKHGELWILTRKSYITNKHWMKATEERWGQREPITWKAVAMNLTKHFCTN